MRVDRVEGSAPKSEDLQPRRARDGEATANADDSPTCDLPDAPPDPEGWGCVPDAAELAGWVPPVPDDVELVTEVAGMMAVFAAEQFARVDGLRRTALADAGRYGDGVAGIAERSVRLELAAALRTTEHAAGMLLARAEALVHRYPAALDSLGRAGITERHAQVLVELLDAATPVVRERLVPRAVELAEELPVGSFRRALRRLIETEQSATLTQRHEHALTQRRIAVEPAGDGMAWLHAFLPAVEAHAIHSRLTAMAKTITGRHATANGDSVSGTDATLGADGDALGAPSDSGPAESRTLDQVRADILGDLLIEGAMAAHPAEMSRIRATVAVTVPALALLAEDDSDRHAQGHAPATVEGIGPVPLPVAKALCGGDPSWMRVLTHPETGIVLSVGRTQYRPPAPLRRLIRWRAERCMAPGCTIPAHRCEIDHNIAWEHGGHTALTNHAPLCTGHHTLKHHGGWIVEHLPDRGGALQWTSPTGRQYIVTPERPTPTFQPTKSAWHAGHTDAPF
ncbi:HNH endonuclease signature motif containing protein [Microbacterium sp. SSM24]|uniref:HNH endonuclease signature motif containing protein n=1 Tax=Microbacterium sp. SSM24 TaxID=2991714 RepID=UPI002225FED1|nr:HNH endonuclease signature motif containing protein [Microbacterium sp. SSM24]MCW3493119.1 HNH endonuclease [Microbacterium sp. SSM24]